MPSYPSNKYPEEDKEQEIKLLLGNIPTFFELSDQFLFQCEKPLSARSRRLPGSTPLPKSTDWILSAVNRCGILQIHPWLPGCREPSEKAGRRLQRCELANEFVHRPSLPFSDGLILAPSNGRAPDPARL
jgi:hypothetical protein